MAAPITGRGEAPEALEAARVADRRRLGRDGDQRASTRSSARGGTRGDESTRSTKGGRTGERGGTTLVGGLGLTLPAEARVSVN